MSYADLLDDLAERVERLTPRRRAAVFWLLGTGLRAELSESEASAWAHWFDEASRLSLHFIVNGRVGNDVAAVLARAESPTDYDVSQLLNSAIICLSSPLDIASDPAQRVGPWMEHALFPVIQNVSLDMFEDVAFPGEDEELEQVVADSRVQAAGAYCASICDRLDTELRLDRQALHLLLDGSAVLNG